MGTSLHTNKAPSLPQPVGKGWREWGKALVRELVRILTDFHRAISNKQDHDARLDQLITLTPTDDYFIVGNGVNWVFKPPSLARIDMGLGTAAVEDIGTSGSTVPLLDTACTVSAAWSFNNISVDSSHNIGVGSFDGSGASQGTQINTGLVRTSTDVTTSYIHRRFVNPNGTVGSIATSGSSTAYNTTSDENLKANERLLRDEFDVLDLIKSLDVLAYNFVNERGVLMSGRSYGLFAQRLYKAYPIAVTPGSGRPGTDGYTPWMIDYSQLMPLSLAATQLLLERVTTLETRVAALEALATQ